MSNEAIRRIAVEQFASFDGLSDNLKSYPNRPEKRIPKSGMWAKLSIEHVARKVISLGSKPCTSRVGEIIIDVFVRLDEGTRKITELTDKLEHHFSFMDVDYLTTGAAYTISFENKDKAYYMATVHVPFRWH